MTQETIRTLANPFVKEGYTLIAINQRFGIDAIIYRESMKDYVVCLSYDIQDGTWGQGRYTGSDINDAYKAYIERISPAREDYDYRAAVIEDVKQYIEDNITLSDYEDRDEAQEALYEEMWTSDSVTGNGSGSYWFSTYKAEEALSHNLDILGEALSEFGDDGDVLSKGAEACDVTIRCYLLSESISAVLDEMEDETWGQDEN